VLDGAFTIASKLYETFTEFFDIDKYHEEVTTEVKMKKSELVAIFFADFFSRKRNGAWMTSYKSQFVKTESTKTTQCM
jgi:peptidyl-dipeptidase Dcp